MKNVFAATLLAISMSICPVLAQESPVSVSEEVFQVYSGGFFSVVRHSGLLGIIIWGTIFLWALALLPLGIISVKHCSTLQSKRWPLATKLLLFGPLFLFVLGWLDVVRKFMRMFSSLAAGAPDVGLLSLNISQAFFAPVANLCLVLLYLSFFMLSFVIIHFKHKQMDDDS